MIRVLLDGNIYDKLAADDDTRALLASCVAADGVLVIATPIVIDELNDSPFEGLPSWFPIVVEPESVFVLGFARLGAARLGDGEVLTKHRGSSSKIKDAIIADSAASIADLFVSEDKRCRKRLEEMNTKCRALTYAEHRVWISSQGNGLQK